MATDEEAPGAISKDSGVRDDFGFGDALKPASVERASSAGARRKKDRAKPMRRTSPPSSPSAGGNPDALEGDADGEGEGGFEILAEMPVPDGAAGMEASLAER